MANAIGRLLVEITADPRQFQRSVNRMASDLDRQANRFATIGQRLSIAFTLPIIAAGRASLSAAMDIGALESALETTMGSATAAKAELEALQRVAEKPGISFEAAVEGSLRLQTAGFAAAEARNQIEQFGNALVLSGKGAAELDGVTLALSQIAAKGSAQAEEINQIAERLPMIRKLMKDAFGAADTDTIRKMGVDSATFIRAITAELEKLPRAQETLKTSFENLGIAARLSLAKVGASIADVLNLQSNMQSFTQAISAAGDSFENLSKPVKQLIVGFAGVAALAGPVSYFFAAINNTASASLRVLAGFADKVNKARIALVAMSTAQRMVAAGIAGLAIGLAVGAIMNYTREMTAAEKVAASFADVNGRAAESVADERVKIDQLLVSLFNENDSKKERKKIISEIIAINPSYFKGLSAEKSSYEEVEAAARSYIDALVITARIKAANDRLVEVVGNLDNVNRIAKEAEPGIWQSLGNSLLSGGNAMAFAAKQADTFGENIQQNTEDLKAEKKALEDLIVSLKDQSKINPVTPRSTPGFRPKGDGGGAAIRVPVVLDVIGGPKSGIEELQARIGAAAQDLQTAFLDPARTGVTSIFAEMSSKYADFVHQVSGANVLAKLGEQFDQIDRKGEVFQRLGIQFDSQVTKLEAVREALENAFSSGATGSEIEGLIEVFQRLGGEMSASAQRMAEFGEQVENSLQSGLADAAVAVAGNLGDMIAGTERQVSVFGQVLMSVANILEQLGKLAITTGIAVAGIKKALQSLNPIAAIAGGVALVALAKIVKAKAASMAPKFDKGGMVTGETLATVGDNPSGKEAIIPFERMGQFLNQFGGGGGNIELSGEFRIAGQDLLLSLDRAQQSRRRKRGR